MTKYTEYVTNQGDRLDLISTKVFGRPDYWAPIIMANPSLPIIPEYPAGYRLRIPVIELAEINQDLNLPPWKR